MAKYISGRSKLTPQTGLSTDRYRFLSVSESEQYLLQHHYKSFNLILKMIKLLSLLMRGELELEKQIPNLELLDLILEHKEN